MEEYYENTDVCINENAIDVAGIVRENKEQEQRELEEKLYNLQCSAPVEDIDDLLWKYEEYNIKVIDDTVKINQPINYKRFLTLKKDMTKLGLTNVIVDT
jgi:hypothetical protein